MRLTEEGSDTMDISNLWTLQVMMFFLVAAGAVLKSTGILKDDAKGILTDLVLYFFLPCNIINSFRMEFNLDILRKFAVVLGISLVVQFVSYVLSKLLYNHVPKELKRVMQYCTIVSNSGFLGLPIAQGIYGAEAVAEAHFGKHAYQLTKSEAALIAATLPNPRKFNSAKPSPYMLKRQAKIISLMGKLIKVEMGYGAGQVDPGTGKVKKRKKWRASVIMTWDESLMPMR